LPLPLLALLAASGQTPLVWKLLCSALLAGLLIVHLLARQGGPVRWLLSSAPLRYDDVRLAAAPAVRHGRSVSCAWEVAVPEEMERSTTTCPCAADMPGAEDMPVPGFRADRRWGFSSERLGITFHGNTVTHVDSPCHIFWDGTMYNGRSHSLVDAATGSGWAAVTAAANGIITRGVLLDIARVRDVPWLEPGQGVFPDDLEEAERRQGVRVRSGDAVLLRTGYGRVRHEAGAASGVTQAGWHASCLP
jgi:hypothetical protein